ncbi:MAG: winged helix-turn-helix transcriptional regulator, partial [Promethearchaeota archaeon]
ENRSKIINYILEHPGTHFNELLRNIGISTGTLVYHLNILETYEIIQKIKVGQFLLYYSCLEKNLLINSEGKISKSRTTLDILQLISEEPGMYQNQIAKSLNLHHKTVKYHLSKLLQNDAIYKQKKKGRPRYYPVMKIILCGDGRIGKTTLATVFCKQIYKDHEITVAVDLHIKKIWVDGELQVLQIWDLSGQEHFRFLLPQFFRGVHGVILGFDISRPSSFRNLQNWLKIIPEVPILLIATKADLGYHSTLDRTDVLEFVAQHNFVDFEEVSAKENFNVETPFKRLFEFIKGFEPDTTPIEFSNEVIQQKSLRFWYLGKDMELRQIRIGNSFEFLKSKEDLELFNYFLERNTKG